MTTEGTYYEYGNTIAKFDSDGETVRVITFDGVESDGSFLVEQGKDTLALTRQAGELLYRALRGLYDVD